VGLTLFHQRRDVLRVNGDAGTSALTFQITHLDRTVHERLCPPRYDGPLARPQGCEPQWPLRSGSPPAVGHPATDPAFGVQLLVDLHGGVVERESGGSRGVAVGLPHRSLAGRHRVRIRPTGMRAGGVNATRWRPPPGPRLTFAASRAAVTRPRPLLGLTLLTSRCVVPQLGR
jgi:hypothetical protein